MKYVTLAAVTYKPFISVAKHVKLCVVAVVITPECSAGGYVCNESQTSGFHPVSPGLYIFSFQGGQKRRTGKVERRPTSQPCQGQQDLYYFPHIPLARTRHMPTS